MYEIGEVALRGGGMSSRGRQDVCPTIEGIAMLRILGGPCHLMMGFAKWCWGCLPSG